MKHRILLPALILALVLAVPVARAQTSPVTLRIDSADSTAFPTVRVRLSAWNQDGLPLSGLESGDFILQEDGGPQLAPASVERDPDAPLRVALVLDVSGSMAGGPLADAKAAAARFLDRLTDVDQAALLAFSDDFDPDSSILDPARELAFSGDLDPVYDLIEDLAAGGETHLYNAVAKAVGLFAGQPQGHLAILLLSDGRNEPAGVGDPQAPIRLAQEANVPVFVIGLGNDIDEPYLRSLANESGGLYRSAPSSAELARLFADMAALLKTQYVLTYDTQLPPDGGMHTLAVTLNASLGSATDSIEIGPFPDAPQPEQIAEPTEAPEPTAAPPTEAPAAVVEPTDAPFPTPELFEEEPAGSGNSSLGWGIAAVVAIVLSGWWYLRRRRGPQPEPMICLNCGFDVTHAAGACPNCGGDRFGPKLEEG